MEKPLVGIAFRNHGTDFDRLLQFAAEEIKEYMKYRKRIGTSYCLTLSKEPEE